MPLYEVPAFCHAKDGGIKDEGWQRSIPSYTETSVADGNQSGDTQ